MERAAFARTAPLPIQTAVREEERFKSRLKLKVCSIAVYYPTRDSSRLQS
jgi:hypothetical protein